MAPLVVSNITASSSADSLMQDGNVCDGARESNVSDCNKTLHWSMIKLSVYLVATDLSNVALSYLTVLDGFLAWSM